MVFNFRIVLPDVSIVARGTGAGPLQSMMADIVVCFCDILSRGGWYKTLRESPFLTLAVSQL